MTAKLVIVRPSLTYPQNSNPHAHTHTHPHLHMYLDKYTRVCVCVFALVPDNYVQFTLHNTRAHENARFRFKLPWLQAACGRDTPVGRQQSYHSPYKTRQRQELSQGIVWPREPLTKVRAKLRHSLPLLVLLLLFPNELLFILYLLYTHPRILYIHVYMYMYVCAHILA